MKQSLKHALKDKLNKPSLDQSQLARLNALQQTQQASEKAEPQITQSRLPRYYAWAASLLLVVALTILVYPKLNQPVSTEQLYAEVAEEVVKNHLYLKPLEVKTQRIGEIQDYFTRLSFRPIESQLAKQIFPGQMLGGRYCSIQGVSAAQLRFQSVKPDSIQTLYQVPYSQETFRNMPDIAKGERPVSLYAKGIKVTLWQEKGVMFALTGE